VNNPLRPQQEPGSYVDLKKRMLQRVQSFKVDDQIFEVVQVAYEDALNKENIVLSRPERVRMFSQILRSVLEDMIKKLDDRSKSA
jgi:hypothetical protein